MEIGLDAAVLGDFCRRWRIIRLEVFGSTARRDGSADSDLDLLVTFAEDANWTLLDVERAQHELSDLVKRSVDLIERSALERSANPIRRRAILDDARAVHVT